MFGEYNGGFQTVSSWFYFFSIWKLLQFYLCLRWDVYRLEITKRFKNKRICSEWWQLWCSIINRFLTHMWDQNEIQNEESLSSALYINFDAEVLSFLSVSEDSPRFSCFFKTFNLYPVREKRTYLLFQLSWSFCSIGKFADPTFLSSSNRSI